jgi:hypothetical protein
MSSLEKYWRSGFNEVQGWVNPNLLECMTLLGDLQHTHKITGNVAEIGVYHGRFLIALSHMGASKAVCIDVFDDQSKNLDGAGEGDLSTLKQNISRYGSRDTSYEFIKVDSIALTATDKLKIMTNLGPFKLFSVDGCHTLEHTHADLLTAQEMLCPGGVVILDDYMQPHWPGVTEAVHLLYQRGVPRIRPFLYSSHKLFFCGVGWHSEFIRAAHERSWGGRDARVVPMFGSPVLTIYP